MVSVLYVDLISCQNIKMLCTSAVAGATRTDVRMFRHFTAQTSRDEARGQNRSKSSFPRIGRDAMIG